jgi:hypothetical protein
MEALKMKAFLLAVALTALSVGVASAQPWSRCFENNSPACTNARNAFAEHHGGLFPEQYYNGWYNGGRGRWYQRGGGWRWEGVDGREYANGPHGWAWGRHHR